MPGKWCLRNLGTSMKKLKSPFEWMKEIEMTTFTPIHAMALASMLAAALSGCADFKPTGTQSTIADAKITAEVEARLNQMPDLGPPGSIVTTTRDHVVYLNGLVDVGLEKRNAESIVMQVPGVTSVVNDLSVSHN
jgi:osmotically-inducible protein OsmY